jgi:hypothetical protein
MQREIEHQAQQYSVRLDRNIRDDARELSNALKGFTNDTASADDAAADKERKAHE